MMTRKRIEHRLSRINKKLEKYEVPNPSEVYTYHGGWSVGYLEGQRSVLEGILDEEEESTQIPPDIDVPCVVLTSDSCFSTKCN